MRGGEGVGERGKGREEERSLLRRLARERLRSDPLGGVAGSLGSVRGVGLRAAAAGVVRCVMAGAVKTSHDDPVRVLLARLTSEEARVECFN